MKAVNPLFISCANAQTQFTDVCVKPHGSLIELNGHPFMLFDPHHARLLAHAILAILGDTPPDNTLKPGWWRVSDTESWPRWIAPLDDWNPENEIDDHK
jgi:hypothetical protein